MAEAHQKAVTVVRSVKARPTGSVYADYLQNIEGKSVASVWSVRPRDLPTVSTPLDWDELTDDLDPRDFTIDTVPPMLVERRALWTRGMSRPNRLDRLTRDTDQPTRKRSSARA